MAKNKVYPIPMASFNTTGLSTSYQVIDAAGLDQSCFLVRIINDSNMDVIISWDGVNDADYLRSTESLQLPTQTNAQPAAEVALVGKGQKFYVKGTGAGTGSVYLSGYYVLP